MLLDLVDTMASVYMFVDAVHSISGKLKVLEDTIKQIFVQTVECTIFIREYTSHQFAGKHYFCPPSDLVLIYSRPIDSRGFA